MEYRKCLVWLILLSMSIVCSKSFYDKHRKDKVLSLFSLVQFANDACTSSSNSAVMGTCLTNTECNAAGGSNSGSCAAGFGICCYVATSTCGDTIKSNNTYITNPNYPSSYTPSSTGTCTFTVSKSSSSDKICQMRFDFPTFNGFTVSTAGVCTDTFAVSGQTGLNPPSICGTNTGYHMYLEVGEASSDTATVTITYGDTSTAKNFFILIRQIECDNPNRAPRDCVQWYTGAAGNLQSYGHKGSQLIQGMDYEICIRDEKGYCGISYVEASGQSIDTFSMLSPVATGTAAAESTTGTCSPQGILITIPMTSADGVVGFTQQGSSSPGLIPFPNEFCGGIFGVDGAASSTRLTTVQKPFGIHVLTSPAGTITAPSTGFNLDYTQVNFFIWSIL